MFDPKEYRWYLSRRIRPSSLVSPFRNWRSGTPENDYENLKRYDTGLRVYLEQYKNQRGITDSWYTNNWRFIIPSIIAPTMALVVFKYSRPSSVFMRSLFPLTAGIIGFIIGIRREVKDNDMFLLRNFKNFEQDVKDALQTGDSRYVRKYWR